MKKKLCFFINQNFIQFGIANKIQKLGDYELYAIIIDNKKMQKFFENQTIVDFKKIWYFSNFYKEKKTDSKYLQKIEEEYQINLWEIIYMDRHFYAKYNKFHKFSYDEVLILLEQACRCYEDVIQTINPDFVLAPPITAYYEQLFYKMCKAKGISVLTTEPTRFGDRWYIAKGVFNENETKKLERTSNKKRTAEDIHNYLKSHKPPGPDLEEIKDLSKISKLEKSKALLEFLLTNSHSFQNFYTYQGKTKLKILTKGTARSHLFKSRKIESFINKNFVKKIDEKNPFIYYPMQEEPEKTILMGAPYYTDQVALITNIAKSLPMGYLLYVKEHPSMKMVGWRPTSIYEEIMHLPNVVLVHPTVNGVDLVKKCSLIISIRGTTAMEGAIFQKPAIVFAADYGWDSIPSIYLIKNIQELPDAIRLSLKKEVTLANLDVFMDFIEYRAFDSALIKYVSDLANELKYNVGYLKKYDISQPQMESFLKRHSDFFDEFAKQFLKKIE